MTQELYNRLSRYESYLITASVAGYIRSLTNSQIAELIGIGNELGIHYTNNHCPKCALEFITKLAKPYMEYKKEMEKQVKSEPVKEQEKEEVKEVQTKKEEQKNEAKKGNKSKGRGKKVSDN